MAVVSDRPVGRNEESRLLYRFPDLKRLGIVGNYTTLLRWIASGDFPAGIYLGANTRAWLVQDVELWLASRPVGGSHG